MFATKRVQCHPCGACTSLGTRLAHELWAGETGLVLGHNLRGKDGFIMSCNIVVTNFAMELYTPSVNQHIVCSNCYLTIQILFQKMDCD